MQRNFEIWTADNSIIIARILGLFMLLCLWIRRDGDKAGVILILFLIIMSMIRWRFKIPDWIIILDQVACILTFPFWEGALFAFNMPLFESLILGKVWLFMPSIIYIEALNIQSFPLVITFLMIAFTGKIINTWFHETLLYRHELDNQRHDTYELEEFKRELLFANSQAAQMSELSERNRIAQELHDSVGHELTAAILAMQAFEHLWKENDPSANIMFLQASERLNKSAVHLRETVHNMKPLEVMGINRLKDICSGYTNLKIEFYTYGDSSAVPVHLWNILEPCLKEALTNVSRHSNGTAVVVTLDINPNIIRLSVSDNGTESKDDGIGIGIRNLRQRTQAAGGSISAQSTDKGFHLICVLPIKREEIK